MSMFGRMRRLFLKLPVWESLPIELRAPRPKTDDEIIAEMENVLLNGPPKPPIDPKMKAVFDAIEKAPLRPQKIFMNQQDFDDILKWQGAPDEG
jgi:hypothetical protein